ncbi:PD-(D/E)XK nuclease family protein [uncultured Thiohalocapsa sp.]|uniref:PD-(D/E)XK nuclease family protein n=1 Tax=uncultured Thiohalocapsa sp. TaxID=768990 RepID=UPI0026012D83|nr:PD-(D/E)XK nuclease family protein [uncultured Thiohalocapsa sp.]
MNVTNNYALPAAIVAAVENDPYSRGDADISVTELIAPAQQRALMREHWHELEEDAADRLFALQGQLIHSLLERANIKHQLADIAERRLSAEVAGWALSGQFDNLILDDSGTLQDYKYSSVWSVKNGVKEEWVAQLNVLRWLVYANGYDAPERLQLVALLRDWSKPAAMRERDYPPAAVQVLDVPVWTISETLRYIVSRLADHEAARNDIADGDKPVPCTPAERWERPTQYAVMQAGRKRAVKLHAHADDAHAHAAQLPKARVEIRPGAAVRCESYCAVAHLCPQRQAELAAADAA